MQNALKENNVDAMRGAIADGADINGMDRYGDPYLVAAMYLRYHDIAKLLIEAGADVNLRGRSYTMAIGRAVSSGNAEIVRMLIEHGADVNLAEPPVMITPLHWACRADVRVKRRYTEDTRAIVVSMLLAAGANVNARDKHGNTPLLSACFGGYPKAVRLLLKNGADPEAINEFTGISPLEAVLRLEEGNPARQELIELFQEYAPELVFGKFCTMSMTPGGM